MLDRLFIQNQFDLVYQQQDMMKNQINCGLLEKD